MKFGGASVKNAEAVRNAGKIIEQFLAHTEAMVVVISAMDKTTNHLEKLAFLARDGREDEAFAQFEKVRNFHLGMAEELFGDKKAAVIVKLEAYLGEIEKVIRGILLLGEFSDRIYDRIVSYGELLSTTLVANFLKTEGLPLDWLDARKVIRTDSTYKSAKVVWSLTREQIVDEVLPQFNGVKVLVTQGFIASNLEGKVTTLGREGSDYTASIFAHCLDAQRLIVWKDVPGILNGDPRIETNTRKLDSLSFEEAVEMTFYGATVIHPKTIKPLFTKNIPLEVKCFLDTSLSGTRISKAEAQEEREMITSRVVKKDQVLLKIRPRDFSFMDQALLDRIFNHIAKAGLMVNLVQTSAISLLLCVNNQRDAVENFQSLLIDKFFVEERQGLRLRTFINYGPESWKEAANAVLVQQAENKLYVVQESPKV